jgi:hypothetical protein
MCSRHYHLAVTSPCSEEGCTEPSISHGLCSKHHTRWLRHGDASTVAFIKGDIEARFWSHVDRRADDECWPWTGYVDDSGYGIFTVDGTQRPAHRWAYIHFVGPILDGLTVDHVKDWGCTRKDCVNFLTHLEVVTNRENILRGDGPAGVNARKTHCIHGHEFTSENTLVRKNGGRTCRTCKRAADKRLRDKKRLI